MKLKTLVLNGLSYGAIFLEQNNYNQKSCPHVRSSSKKIFLSVERVFLLYSSCALNIEALG